ncbi:MAG: type II secretion system F family protein [bacterium]
MTILAILCVICWGLALAGLTWYCLQAAREITYVTLADGRRQERTIPFLLRLLLPLTPNFFGLTMRPAFTRSRELADRRLVSAGFDGLLDGREFLALKILVPLVMGTLWFILLRGAARLLSPIEENLLNLTLLGFFLLYMYPVFWLKQSLAARHRSIQRALPFVLDLLTLSVEAGMDFMSALQRNCERRKLDALNEELIRMIREIQLGTPRRVALSNMSKRVDLADLRSVTYSLVQADELGVSIGAILRIQADQMRQRRFDRAERLANEAPVKLLFPLMLFIFPCVFIILLGPILQQSVGKMF